MLCQHRSAVLACRPPSCQPPAVLQDVHDGEEVSQQDRPSGVLIDFEERTLKGKPVGEEVSSTSFLPYKDDFA